MKNAVAPRSRCHANSRSPGQYPRRADLDVTMRIDDKARRETA
jgi:hypothetical protein